MNEEQGFREWSSRVPNQRGRIFSNQQIDAQVKLLKEDLPSKLNEVDNIKNYSNLFEFTNIEKLKSIKERLSGNYGGELYDWDYNENGHGGASASLYRYIKYLESKANLLDKKEKVDNMNKTKNIILYGPPGVGKTHNCQRLVSLIEQGKDEKTIFDTLTNNQNGEIIEHGSDEVYATIEKEQRLAFITFHQSYSYEDFIEGFRPNEDGTIKLEDGIFKIIVEKALEDKEKNYYIVIDEINRGNISKIFGELITLIEEDKRDHYKVTLPYSKDSFTIPSNLYIIATMNSTDKSIATIDIALRRRFTFLKMKPNAFLVRNTQARDLMQRLNDTIQQTLGEEFLLGHSYFMGDDVDLDFIKEYKIRPLLEEYFYADESIDIDELLKDNNAT